MLAQLSSVVICWLLAAIFALALHHKLTAWTRFKASFAAYKILPEAMLAPATVVLCIAESVTVLLLLALAPLGLLLGGALLAVYGLGIALNVARGRRHIDCGCGDEPTPVSWWTVSRNVTLVALAWAAYVVPPGPLGLSVIIVGIALALVAFGLYNAIEQLLANRGRHQRLWLGV